MTPLNTIKILPGVHFASYSTMWELCVGKLYIGIPRLLYLRAGFRPIVTMVQS